MKRSLDRILTTHVGSLPRPNDLVELYRNDAPESQLFPRLRSAIAEVVRAQSSSGTDIVNDGEFGKAMLVRSISARGGLTSTIGWRAST